MEHRHYRRPRRRRSVLGRLMTFLVICLVLFLGVSVFFRVDEIVVTGETRYSDEEVIAASGIASGDHLFLINAVAAGREIRTRLPYIGQAEIRRQFPNRLEITVSETAPVAKLRFEGGYLILDRDAKIVEHTTQTPLTRLVHLLGLPEPLLPREGEVLNLGEDEADRLRYLRDILAAISTLGIAGDVSRIDLTELHDPEMIYLNERFTVRLGPNRGLHHKIDLLVGIVATIAEDDRGTIDLNPAMPVFRPERPDVPDELDVLDRGYEEEES